jgi:hypothetical protein
LWQAAHREADTFKNNWTSKVVLNMLVAYQVHLSHLGGLAFNNFRLTALLARHGANIMAKHIRIYHLSSMISS